MTQHATPTRRRGNRTRAAIPHLIAGSLALLYAWLVSDTRYVTSGVQFVSPLAILLIIHLCWIGAFDDFRPGFAVPLFGRMLTTALGIVAFTAALAIYAPAPATAASGWETIAGLLGALSCLAVLAGVVAFAAGVIYVVGGSFIYAAKAAWEYFRGPPGPRNSRFLDAGAVGIALIAIGASSLEGIEGTFAFATPDHASSTVIVAAPPDRVWREVGIATSPSFPLPVMLQSIPQPVAVIVDEGAALGARRVVRFKGREGEGDMVLQVTRRTNEEAVFEALSDSSPIAMWVQQRALTFRVEPHATGSRLTVSSDYERLLSPAWFFKPYIRFASYLAADVLARDTKTRAEFSM